MSLSARIDDIVRPIAPAERLAAVRILTGTFAVVYLAIRAPALMAVAHHDPADFAPAGLARFLSAPLPPWAVQASVVATCLLSLAFVAGWFFRWSGPLFAILSLWVLGYRNSFGMIFHTENLFVLHVIILSFCDSAAALSLDARRGGSVAPAPARRYGFALQCLGVVTVFAYVLAGIAKLKVSGTTWATGDILRNHIAHDNLRKALLGDSYSELGAWTARHGWMFPPFAVMTLAIELLAPLALLRGRVAKAWCLLAWSFHVGVLALMWILFPYQLFFVSFASFFEPERWIERVRRMVAKRPAPARS